MAVNKALLRVRRLLSSELQTVMSVAEGAVDGQDGGLSGLQAVQLLQHQQLLPGKLQPGDPVNMAAPCNYMCCHGCHCTCCLAVNTACSWSPI